MKVQEEDRFHQAKNRFSLTFFRLLCLGNSQAEIASILEYGSMAEEWFENCESYASSEHRAKVIGRDVRLGVSKDETGLL